MDRRVSVRRSLTTLSVVLSLATAGCMSHTLRLQGVRTAFHRGDIDAARRLLDEDAGATSRDADLVALDRAMVALADDDPAEAERLLRRSRDRFDHLAQADAAETGLALVSDDTATAYSGDDHERVLLRGMLAIANLVQDGDDADAYSLQVVEEQGRIVAAAANPDGTNPKAAYGQVALAPYLRGVFREATHRDYDDASRHFAIVTAWQPDFRPGPEHLARARQGVHSTKGHGIVHVIAAVGHGPVKVEAAEIPSTASLAIASGLLGGSQAALLPPVVAPIVVPRVVSVPGSVATVRVTPHARPTSGACTETITNVSTMAKDQCDAMLPDTVARAIVRRSMKQAAIVAARETLGGAGSLPAVAVDLAGIAWQASERADTRSWSLLPDTIQVARLELPAGDQAIAIEPLDHKGGRIGRSVSVPVTVRDGRDTFVFVQSPDAGIVGTPLVSD
jgi:hypothetical protein